MAYWFTGTNLIQQTINSTKRPYTHTSESPDGNPGRPGGLADLMAFDCPARICWLALCSGPALRRDGRRIFPPSDLWKETRCAYTGWSEDVVAFQDGLG